MRMPVPLIIRSERPDDHIAIGDVIRRAFSGMPYADGDEDALVETLRRANALSVSLVAESADRVVGQVTLSPATASDGTPGWYALGPLAVLPAHQRGGLGAGLVQAGLQAIAERGANGCILTGNPAYYARFGFGPSPSNAPPGEPVEFFMIKLLDGRQPVGPIFFHPAFGNGAHN